MEYASRSQLAELDRQLERGSLFTQATLQRGFQRIDEAETLLVSLVRALAAKGLVSEDEIGVCLTDAEPVEPDPEPDPVPDDDPRATQPAINWPSVALRVDSGEPVRSGVVVDCDARMPVCHAVCCRLKFPLTVEEVDAGHVKWDIGHPYIIRHESGGACTHNDPATGRCGVYEHRPAVCRDYSCAGDTRIWKDFDAMVLNQEWIDANLVAHDLHVTTVMPSMEQFS